MRVLLDANFLMIPGQFGVDIFAELRRVLHVKHDLVTLDAVIKELEKIAAGRGKDARAARIALLLLEQKSVRVLKSKRPADRAIIELAREGDTIVCTQDKPLQRAVRKAGAPIVFLKAKRYLAVEGLLV